MLVAVTIFAAIRRGGQGVLSKTKEWSELQRLLIERLNMHWLHLDCAHTSSKPAPLLRSWILIFVRCPSLQDMASPIHHNKTLLIAEKSRRRTFLEAMLLTLERPEQDVSLCVSLYKARPLYYLRSTLHGDCVFLQVKMFVPELKISQLVGTAFRFPIDANEYLS